MKHQRVCEACGTGFLSSWKNAKFCCKFCRRKGINDNYRARYAKWPQRSISKTMVARRARSERRWQAIFDKLGNKCAKCENTYPKVVYDLHHPQGKKSRDDQLSRILAQAKEDTFLQHLQEWQLLCANCHRLHHAETDWAPRWRRHELQADN